MTYILDITRQQSTDSQPYVQSIPFETDDPAATVAFAMRQINASPDCKDINGETVTPISWECGCLQRKCGACAMVISGRPMLACDAVLSRVARGGRVSIAPLKKFPLVKDLTVDRSAMMEALKSAEVWLKAHVSAEERNEGFVFDASRCLQCGCCLEVCPNFYAGGEFSGTAAALPMARLMAALPERDRELEKSYLRHFYNGCGKSLACRNICPAGIDVDSLLVNSNAAAVWKRRFGGRGR